jgi:hypothetical protein
VHPKCHRHRLWLTLPKLTPHYPNLKPCTHCSWKLSPHGSPLDHTDPGLKPWLYSTPSRSLPSKNEPLFTKTESWWLRFQILTSPPPPHTAQLHTPPPHIFFTPPPVGPLHPQTRPPLCIHQNQALAAQFLFSLFWFFGFLAEFSSFFVLYVYIIYCSISKVICCMTLFQ